MAKRGALSEMNHDNWDQEADVEEAGVFKQASDDVIKQRIVKKAKRRNVPGQNDGQDGEAPTAFKGFSGFVSSNTKPAFSFNKDSKPFSGVLSYGGSTADFTWGKTLEPQKDTVSAVASKDILSVDPKKGNLSVESQKEILSAEPKTEILSVEPQKILIVNAEKKIPSENKPRLAVNGNCPANRSLYLQQLRALNESVTKWITEHVKKNGHCVLTPIFKDYEKHLAEVEKLNPERHQESSESSKEKTKFIKIDVVETRPETKEEPVVPVKQSAAKPPTPFSFGSGTAALSNSTTSLFGSTAMPPKNTSTGIFGSSTSATPFATAGFSFGSGTTAAKPFSFATSSAPSQNPNEEEEYIPPKEEVKEIKEADAFYSKKCKLYFQKSGTWVERGIGHIHLKPCGEKTQLLIRADTNLGNILMNIMLSTNIPLGRQGKNNVTMMCMPNPPIDPKEKEPKPVSFLIRVKTAEEADDLLEKLKENQK